MAYILLKTSAFIALNISKDMAYILLKTSAFIALNISKDLASRWLVLLGYRAKCAVTFGNTSAEHI